MAPIEAPKPYSREFGFSPRKVQSLATSATQHVDAVTQIVCYAAMDVTVYTRNGCHLCDDAIELLRTHGLEPLLQDIDVDEEMREKFTDCVPVVEIDGQIRFRGRVDPVLLRRLIKEAR